MNYHDGLRPHSADSEQGAWSVPVQESSPICIPARIIQLQDSTESLWCASGGRWVKDRRHAVRFASNIDAIAYCVALSLAGHVVGFDASGREVYRLETDHIVKAFAQPHVARSVSPFPFQNL